MPVIVIGADTPEGAEIFEALADPDRELRVFVSDPDRGGTLRTLGAKVALGDVSDESHVSSAAMGCFSAVLISSAATDDREISFARTPRDVLEGWARAVSAARVTRVIWLTGDSPPDVGIDQIAIVDPASPDYVERVVALDDAATI